MDQASRQGQQCRHSRSTFIDCAMAMPARSRRCLSDLFGNRSAEVSIRRQSACAGRRRVQFVERRRFGAARSTVRQSDRRHCQYSRRDWAATGSAARPVAGGQAAAATAGIQLGNLGSGFGNAARRRRRRRPAAAANISAGRIWRRRRARRNSVVLPGIRIAADVTNNSLVIYASQANYRLIEQMLDADSIGRSCRWQFTRQSPKSRSITICSLASNIIFRTTTARSASTRRLAATAVAAAVAPVVLPEPEPQSGFRRCSARCFPAAICCSARRPIRG